MEKIYKEDLENIKQEMCRITKKRKDTVDDLNINFKNILSDIKNMNDIDIEELQNIIDYEFYFDNQKIPVFKMYNEDFFLREVGGAICKENDNLSLRNVEYSCTSAGCSIDFTNCEDVGSFHTHPLNSPFPSLPDLKSMMFEDHELMCVGSKIENKSKVLCIVLEDKNKIEKDISRMYMGYEYEPDAKLEFYRELPIPSPSELLKSMTYDDISYYYNDEYSEYDSEDEFVKKFREELREGIIPIEYKENYESEGEINVLNIYLAEKQKEIYKIRKEQLAKYFKLYEFDCGYDY